MNTQQKRLLKIRKRIKELYEEAYSIEKSLKGLCDHPQTSEYVWEHDNGYGIQSDIVGLRCDLCGAVKAWKNSSSWSYREDWR